MRSKMLIVVSIFVAASMFLAGFSAIAPVTSVQAASPTATAEPAKVEVKEIELPEVDPADLKGDIYSAGSSTVGPLSEAVQELFVQDGFEGEIKNDIIGSGGGFERFCKTGETDIANASRKIKDEEVENCGKLNPCPQACCFPCRYRCHHYCLSTRRMIS